MAKKKQSKKDLFFSTNVVLDNLLDGHEKELSREFVTVLTSIKSTLANAYEKFGTDGILTREEVIKFGRLTKIEQYLIEQIHQLTKTQIRITKDSIRNVFAESYYRYGYMIENESEFQIYKMLNPEIVDQMLFNELDLVKWDERVKENNQILVRQLREELAQGIVQGVGYSVIAKAVSERLNIGLNKAKRIARTECRRVQEEANLRTMKEANGKGLVTKKQWVSTLDSRTRDTHKHLDGQVVGIDEMFTSRSGKEAIAPHKFGVAKEDINCRCTMISVIEDENGEVMGQKSRRAKEDKDNEVIEYATYNEWQKSLKNRK